MVRTIQNTDMLRLPQCEFTGALWWITEVRHAIFQCYVKETLLSHFSMSDVKERQRVNQTQDLWHHVLLVTTYSIVLQINPIRVMGIKNKGTCLKTERLKMVLHQIGSSELNQTLLFILRATHLKIMCQGHRLPKNSASLQIPRK